MNQENYKTIAKILHEMRGKFFGIRERQIFDGYMKELADYFESSFEYCGRRWGVVNCDKDTPCYNCERDKFNRELFLQWCGVK